MKYVHDLKTGYINGDRKNFKDQKLIKKLIGIRT